MHDSPREKGNRATRHEPPEKPESGRNRPPGFNQRGLRRQCQLADRAARTGTGATAGLATVLPAAGSLAAMQGGATRAVDRAARTAPRPSGMGPDHSSWSGVSHPLSMVRSETGGLCPIDAPRLVRGGRLCGRWAPAFETPWGVGGTRSRLTLAGGRDCLSAKYFGLLTGAALRGRVPASALVGAAPACSTAAGVSESGRWGRSETRIA
jgi:hypothetical protein